jgi:hypothetical protein
VFSDRAHREEGRQKDVDLPKEGVKSVGDNVKRPVNGARSVTYIRIRTQWLFEGVHVGLLQDTDYYILGDTKVLSCPALLWGGKRAT